MKMKNYCGKWVMTFIIVVLALIFSGDFLYADTSKKPENQIKETDRPINWYSYDEGMALGKRQGKKIFLYFWAEWCPFCKKMERETFNKSLVTSNLNNNFIPIRVNSEKERKTAFLYNVRGLPTSWFLTGDGQKISNLPGYVPPDMFLRILEFIYSDSYKKMTFGDYLKSEK